MAMIYGITYTDNNMGISAERCRDSMMKHGCDHAIIRTEDWINQEFKLFNSDIFNQERGAHCYWLFKPYIIYKLLQFVEDGNIIFYSDAGIEIINPIHPIIYAMDQDIFLFDNNFPHVEWCKGSVIKEILPWLHYSEELSGIKGNKKLEMMRSYKQVQASSIFIKVNQTTREFVKEWLLYCQMPGLIDDSPSKAKNFVTFAEHRHDQAILTCLQIKHGYKTHWFPTTTAQHIREFHPEDKYDTTFWHHRKRNNEW